ncbi:hypothetical protein EGI22_20350 [Lacihabitans sp. LS3-19]|uniref:hypothetical protein n=1 Tax=Lacihabitans sp. LS3-19 TaxID=2487335 RepID=UPI0020CE2DE3|nr:hypothetical protein [Lacihabitans sp. LS3-19]MCP9770263.1 hypothetical protein [Lacihabitans sp. LS3-19]
MLKYLLFLIPFQVAVAQADTISFTLNKQSNICINARINNSDTISLMFHTSNTGLNVIKSSAETKIPLRDKEGIEIKTWGGNAETEFSKNNSLYIGRQKWENLDIFIDDNSGPGTDGKFGYDMFENKIVSIDYDQKLLIISENLPQKTKGYQKMKMSFSRGSMFIEGTLMIGKEIYNDHFMFHSGYGGAILLDPKIAEKYKMANLKTISTSELRDSFNNVFKIETKLLPKIKIGKKTLKNVPVSFAARSSEIPMKVFGNDLLKRFNIIFDFQKNEIYLKPNGLWNMAYNVKK